MKIKFNQEVYILIDPPNIHGSHFQATIDKTDISLDSLLEDIKDSSTITVYEDDDNVVGIYTGYTQNVVTSIYDNYISLEFENTNVEEMIINLQEQMNTVESIVKSNNVLKITFPNYTGAASTIYNDSITSNMIVVNKEIVNKNATITDFNITISGGSVTLTGVASDVTDVNIYLAPTL